MPATTEVSPGGRSILGKNLVFDGTVTGSEPLLIEGSVKGKIELSGDLRIGAGATVEATVHAKNVLVEGSITGDLSADLKVELVAGSNVDGNIRAPKIVVAEGARFRGAVDMGSEPPKQDA
jgi:cytoskeletal protein CcmA (bactofilin family)